MANSSTPETAPKVIKIQRFQIGLNVLAQFAVIVGIIAMLNYVSFRHYKRWDYSRDQKYALSGQTKNLLKNLKKPVRAIIFFSSAAEIDPEIKALLREYEFAADKKNFSMEVVDPYRNLSRAQELQAKYKFGSNENIVILDYDGQSKFVYAPDMAEFEMPDQMQMMSGQTAPRIKAFKGEQAVTSALLQLVEGKPSKVYLVAGHGEPGLDAEEMKIFGESLKRQNIQAAPINLLNVNSVPEDCRTLIICGPKYDFSELEMKLLEDYWAKHGRIFILLDPFAQTPRLRAFVSTQGVVPQDDRVVRTGVRPQLDAQGKPEFATIVVNDPTFIVSDSRTKITKDLEGLSKQFLGATQSLQMDAAQQTVARTRVFPLIRSGEGFWGETDLAGDEKTVTFDPKKDHAGPLILAAAVEKGGVEDQRVKVDSSRMIVIGNAKFLSVEAFRLSEGITVAVTTNALNWLLDREDTAIGIPPREKKNVTLSLTDQQLDTISTTVMVFIPCIVAFFGLITWLQRRS